LVKIRIKLWDINPLEDDDLEDINFEELVSIME